MVWNPLLLSHLLHRFLHLWGGWNTISSIFLLSSLQGTWSSPRDFSFCIPTKFSCLLVCNAWKREQSCKTAINFMSDGRLVTVFLWNENDKNYAMGGEFSWFDLPIKLHKKRGVQGLNSPMVWIPLLSSHLLHRFWHLWGGRNTIYSIFLLSRLYGAWSSPWGFLSTLQKNSWPPSV